MHLCLTFPSLILLVVVGCSPSSSISERGPDGMASGVSDQLQGNVSIDGSSTVFPISESAASQFQKQYPNVNVTVAMSGTGGGFKRFARGETDLSNASRPIKEEEAAAARSAGVSFIEVPVAHDGLTIAVHTSNDWVDQLTLDELKTIFLADSAPETWSQIRSTWPDREIQVFAPGTDSGTLIILLKSSLVKTVSYVKT